MFDVRYCVRTYLLYDILLIVFEFGFGFSFSFGSKKGSAARAQEGINSEGNIIDMWYTIQCFENDLFRICNTYYYWANFPCHELWRKRKCTSPCLVIVFWQRSFLTVCCYFWKVFSAVLGGFLLPKLCMSTLGSNYVSVRKWRTHCNSYVKPWF